MQISSSSIFITFIISGILILIFNALLKNKKNYHLFRIDFLSVLSVIIFFRLLFPVEFIFTYTIEFPIIMNSIQNILLAPVYKNWLFSHILLFTWIFVAIFLFIHYIFVLFKLNKSVNKLIATSNLVHNTNCEYPIYQAKSIHVPTIFATKKAIFLPIYPYSTQEFTYILAHESQHIKNHDILIKHLVNILNIIYWWNPFVYIYKKQMRLLLELRVDSQLTDTLSNQKAFEYIQSLISIQKKMVLKNDSANKYLSANFIDENKNILNYRINYLIENNFKNKTNKLLLCILVIIPFCANSIIFEAYFEPENNAQYYELNDFKNGYITKEKDGTYKLHFDGMDATIENPHSKEFNHLQIFDNSKENN